MESATAVLAADRHLSASRVLHLQLRGSTIAANKLSAAVVSVVNTCFSSSFALPVCDIMQHFWLSAVAVSATRSYTKHGILYLCLRSMFAVSAVPKLTFL